MFCPTFRPALGGAERQAEKLALALAARGCTVEVWTPRRQHSAAVLEIDQNLSVHRFKYTDLAKRYPRSRGIGVLNGPLAAYQIARAVWSAVGSADIVHCHIGCFESVVAACVARAKRVPVICKAAVADSRSDMGEMEKAGVTGRIAAMIAPKIFVRWIATTEAVYGGLTAAGVPRKRIALIPNGVSVSKDAMLSSPRPVRRFLYLGRLSRNIDRDIRTLVAAFDHLAMEHPEVELAIVGDGDLYGEAVELAKATRSVARIQVPGVGDPAAWLTWAECFILPSRREGLSNALLEAMAAGLPCIANDIPANREVLDGGAAGMLVPLGDAAALTGAMRLLANDGHVATALAERGEARARLRYSMEATTDAYLQLYASMAGSPHGRGNGAPVHDKHAMRG
jgi:glycosyltransferase involved in cell wall biosynthesis